MENEKIMLLDKSIPWKLCNQTPIKIKNMKFWAFSVQRSVVKNKLNFGLIFRYRMYL